MSIQGSINSIIQNLAGLKTLEKGVSAYKTQSEAEKIKAIAQEKEVTLKGEDVIKTSEGEVKTQQEKEKQLEKQLKNAESGKTVGGKPFASEGAKKGQVTRINNKLQQQKEATRKAQESLEAQKQRIRGGKQGGEIF